MLALNAAVGKGLVDAFTAATVNPSRPRNRPMIAWTRRKRSSEYWSSVLSASSVQARRSSRKARTSWLVLGSVSSRMRVPGL